MSLSLGSNTPGFTLYMKKKTVVIALLCLAFAFVAALILYPLGLASGAGASKEFVFEHVNVVDVVDGSIKKNMSVAVSGGKISTIVPAGDYISRPGVRSIPAQGKYLIPGLWDMHTHSIKLSPQVHHPLFIAHGVTGVRDMSGCLSRNDSFWGCIADREKWTAEALSGDRVSPRYILQSSFQIDGGSEVPSGFPAFFKLDDVGDASKLVDFNVSAGADFIKVHHKVPLKKYDELTSAAAAAGLDVAGHQPLEVSLEHALDAGQKSIEHGRIFLLECYQGIAQYQSLENPIPYNDANFLRRLLEFQDRDKCAAMMESMAQAASWWVPTLTTLRSAAFANDKHFLSDERLHYVPFLIRKLFWSQDVGKAARTGFDDAGNFVHKDLYALAVRQVGQANGYGVKLLVGTDTLDSYVFAGSSLHDELASLVSAGLSPLQALQAATISAAKFSNKQDQFGSIEAGKAADLVLLNANPLEDIANTTSIMGVMFNGIYYDKTALDGLRKFALEQAASLRINLHFALDVIGSPLMRMQIAD